jgi:hypothetical protein
MNAGMAGGRLLHVMCQRRRNGMHEVKVTVPHGDGGRVAEIALAAGRADRNALNVATIAAMAVGAYGSAGIRFRRQFKSG